MNTVDLPTIIAGPIIRHASKGQVVIWLVCAEAVPLELVFQHEGQLLAQAVFQPGHDGHVAVGTHAHLHLLRVEPVLPTQPFPEEVWINYDIGLPVDGQVRWLRETLPHLLYHDDQQPRFAIKPQVRQLLHGSCRKPHYPGGDSLRVVDAELAAARLADTPEHQPALLMLTGDQVYVDDVAGPMLSAIHQVIEHLGLYEERLDGTEIGERHALHKRHDHYYRRPELLPNTQDNALLRKVLFTGARKPIFTSANADNHLITLAEMLGMYLLVWSPALWQIVDLEARLDELSGDALIRYQGQLEPIRAFAQGLPQVQRALAGVPVYMIFDDHDITDDWNLSRAWEESAYGHPLSKRIIGNALIAYFLCQGWGNVPWQFPPELVKAVQALFRTRRKPLHTLLVDQLLKREGWHYSIPTQPKLVVLDTRTQRWRAESRASDPSGLMDWEMLSDLQQELINEKAVILVSPAPIFGVKLIEVVQRVFTWFGYSLVVDAENWMAHPGSANVILNIFRHKRTPHNFVILSGDVHYSFVYDVRLRYRDHSPHIWQITASGIKNAFPATLLRIFDRLNRWLFASYSPLNWLTRRRHMRIHQRRPGEHAGRYRHQRLHNGSSIGRVFLDADGAPVEIEMLTPDGEAIPFLPGYASDWVD